MSELTAYRSGGEGSRATAPVSAIAYEGRVGEVAAIALQNALFNLITLGFYRFWAKTRLRRYIWGSIEYRGERLEYTGRGGELFLGFLVAIAILLALVFAFELAIEAAGGQVVNGPMDIPGVGRTATVHDPQGGNFNVMQPAG